MTRITTEVSFIVKKRKGPIYAAAKITTRKP